MRISDWSSDVCPAALHRLQVAGLEADLLPALPVVGHLFPAVADQGGQLAPLQFRDLSGRKPLAGFMLAQVVQGAPSTHGLVAGVEEVAEGLFVQAHVAASARRAAQPRMRPMKNGRPLARRACSSWTCRRSAALQKPSRSVPAAYTAASNKNGR